MAEEVTDPALLARLNAPEPGVVTDPALLAKLNDNTVPTSIGDAAHSAASGFGRGVLESPGMVGDLRDMAMLGVGKVAKVVDGWVPALRHLDEWAGTTGDQLQQRARDGLSGKVGYGTKSIADMLDRAGIVDYKPQGDLAQSIYDVGKFAGNAATGGLEGLAARGITKGVMPTVRKVLTTGATDTAIGAGAGVGAEVGKDVADGLNVQNPWGRFALETLPALAGGKLTGSALNRSVLYEKPAILNDYKEAGVTPRFPSDINKGNGDLLDGLFDNIGNRKGAQGASRANAASTQQQISDDLSQRMGWSDRPSLEDQGKRVQDALHDELINRESAINEPDPWEQSVDPDVAAARGEAFSEAKKSSQPIMDNPVPETIPGKIASGANLGPSRLNMHLDLLPPQTQADVGAWTLANKAVGDNGQFDLDQLMKYWKDLPQNSKDSMTLDPLLKQSLERSERLYDATQNSRDFANAAPPAATKSDILGSMAKGGTLGAGLAGAQQVLGSGLDLVSSPTALTVGAGLGAAAGAAKVAAPAAAKALQMFGQSGPGLGRMSAPIAGNMASGGHSLAITSARLPGAFSDVYNPPPAQQHAELPSGADVQQWLGSTDRASATNFVQQRLGPDVAKQLATTDPDGYKAALFNLSSDPNYRKQLAANPLPAGGGDAGDITG